MAWQRRRLGSTICPILVFLLCFSGDLRCAAQSPAPSPQLSRAPSPQPSPAPSPEPTPAPNFPLPDSELSALKAIAAKLKIGSETWNFSLDPCNEWPKEMRKSPAVTKELNCTCNATTKSCHVKSISLKSTNLTGELPDEDFGNLTHLATLDLTRNYINGSIPTTWAKLPLVRISIIGNRLSGQIPEEIGDIGTLEELVLENNLLGGQIPASLGNLGNLKRLLLSANNFVGEVPASLGKLTNLTNFRIDGTGISGKFPSFIGNWKLLKRLDMQGTSLEGPFPSTLSELTKLEELRVSDFKGDGDFPELEKMSSLKRLILRNCSISRPIPKFLGDLSKLKVLDLSFNNFTGEIPQTFQNLEKKVDYMFLTNNMLNGTIPDWILGSDENIDLSYNYFTELDKGQCGDSNVNLVSSLQSSKSDKISYCLKKNLPCSTEAENFEFFIDCGGPGHVVNGTEYERDDGGNRAESTFFRADSKKWAWSSTGVFVGDSKAPNIRTNASALKTVNPLYLSARTSASSLKYYGLCLQNGSYKVKLHFAEIIFTDDQTYASLGRRFFDVAIQGKKVLENFNIAEANGTGQEIIKSFDAPVNNTLEIDFRWSGKGTNAIPYRGFYGPLVSAISVTPNFEPRRKVGENKDNGLSSGAIAGIIIGCLLAISLIILIPCILLRKKEQENEELKQLKLQGTYFSLRQVKAATKNFNPENKIGEGGFGPVYKGVLPDGSVVAVKQLSSKSKQGNREFVNEIGMISALQHAHLVKLFGCCIEGSQLLLVYEYLENNSLARALFGPEEARLKLDWQRRHKISLDIARGLAYLHEESRLKIVHRDIKATNILLDKDLNAKISDFGLAKLDDEENTHISTRIAGTIGYMAPEYAMRGYLTEKADVYSYGVVLLEIVSGKSNTNYRPKEDFVYLLDWAYVLKDQGKLLDLVDPSLGSNYSTTEAEQMLNLALLCTNPSPTLRPIMTSVVSMIEGGTLVTAPSVMVVRTASAEMRFKAFEKLSHDSQAVSSNGPWLESSVALSSSSGDATSTSVTARLIDDSYV